MSVNDPGYILLLGEHVVLCENGPLDKYDLGFYPLVGAMALPSLVDYSSPMPGVRKA